MTSCSGKFKNKCMFELSCIVLQGLRGLRMCDINDNLLLFISTFPYHEKKLPLLYIGNRTISRWHRSGRCRGNCTWRICYLQYFAKKRCASADLNTTDCILERKPFQCVICNMRFVNRGSLHYHKKICTKDVGNRNFIVVLFTILFYSSENWSMFLLVLSTLRKDQKMGTKIYTCKMF